MNRPVRESADNTYLLVIMKVVKRGQVILLGGVILCIFFVSFLFGCGETCDKRCKRIKTISVSKEAIADKPIVNVYMENSGSMYGYVNGLTEFEQAVYSYLSDININCTDSLNLFYINSRIIPQQTSLSTNENIEDFIHKLGPANFISQGGNSGITDVADMLKVILSKMDKNTVSMFISDCIFSPGIGKDAQQYLVNQQIGIKSSFAKALKANPELCVVAYRLNAQFKGKYYNREDAPLQINAVRPFYILLIGDENMVKSITAKIPKEKIKGKGVEASFSINNTQHATSYAILNAPKIGSFSRCKTNPRLHILQAKKAEIGKNKGGFIFTVGVDFSPFVIEDDYLTDAANYEISSRDYDMSILPSPKSEYTHLLSFSLKSTVGKPGKTNLIISLKKRMPAWIDFYNDDEGLDIMANDAMLKTYGLKYLLGGIYEAFTMNNENAFTDFKLYIN